MSETIYIGGRTNRTTTLKEMLENKLVEEFAIIELKNLKAEIEDLLSSYGYLDMHTNNDVLGIIDKHIAELKGE